MITITLKFDNVQAIEATLLMALHEVPAKYSYLLIQQIQEQIKEQTQPKEST